MNNLLKSKTFILDVILIFLGCIIASLGVNLFLTHAKLLSGGATGIALIFQYLLAVPAGIVVFIINLPLFFLSYKKLSKSFTLYSAIGMLSLSAALIITKPLASFVKVDDILLYCIYGGVLCGIGYGIVFLRNGSTGGTDIITMLIRQKYSNFEIGKLGFIINCIIVIVGAIIFGVPRALYTLLSIFIQGAVLDRVLRGLNSKKLMLIITKESQNIIDFVIEDMNRGVTSIPIEGEYTHMKKKMLYCIVTTSEMLVLKNKVYDIDPKAFITIMDTSEVKGKGFKSI
ncbi:YitT family protein [Clostridium baratii]|uniref:YitT family protein n=1 Tax=Clostridium baratii TaxID=1561 RepID=UPI002903DCC6|nr:YitT family protein [Clostridium baratii]MDU1054739.1 YitT family protein [Clostridium baratii]MDU4911869.1 YitT family protein [Clostridium baratii]